jgi:hypothetical protein
VRLLAKSSVPVKSCQKERYSVHNITLNGETDKAMVDWTKQGDGHSDVAALGNPTHDGCPT